MEATTKKPCTYGMIQQKSTGEMWAIKQDPERILVGVRKLKPTDAPLQSSPSLFPTVDTLAELTYEVGDDYDFLNNNTSDFRMVWSYPIEHQ